MTKLTPLTFVLILNFSLLTSLLAQNPAPTSDLILSEVYYDAPGGDDGDEWVELFNRGNSAIDLSNYSLGNGGSDYLYSTVQLSGIVQPHSFFVVGGPNSSADNGNPVYDFVYKFSSNFQNSDETTADGVALFNLPADEITSATVPIDMVIYGPENLNTLMNTLGLAGAVDVGDAPSGNSIERISANPNLWQIQANPNPNTSTFQGSLPVELTAFEALPQNGVVQLKWQTSHESTNLGFYVYRSNRKDDDYQRISETLIAGAGTSNEIHEYSFIDKAIDPEQTYFYKLAQIDYDGNMEMHGPISVHPDSKPLNCCLFQNYPNPFNPKTTIKFSQNQAGEVHLAIINLRGQTVKTLVNAEHAAGTHSIVWNGTDDNGNRVASGIYFYVLQLNNYQQIKQLILLE